MSPLSLPQVPRGVIILGLCLTLSLGPSHLRLEAAGHPRVGGRVGDGLRGHHRLTKNRTAIARLKMTLVGEGDHQLGR